MSSHFPAARILFVETDETSFEVRKCMAKVLAALPPVLLFHAKDATEALTMMESVKPDVVVLDDEMEGEHQLFLDSLATEHPPVVVRSEGARPDPKTFTLDQTVTYIPKSETLEGIHNTLMLVAAIGVRSSAGKQSEVLH